MELKYSCLQSEQMNRNDDSKTSFFDQLYDLDRADTGTQETCEIALLLKRSRHSGSGRNTAPTRIPKRILGLMGHASPGLLRTVSEPLPRDSLNNSPSEYASIVKETPLPKPKHQAFGKHLSITSSPPPVRKRSSSPTEIPTMPGKRKRGRSLQIMPESQQVFKGLFFYFFPNNNIAPARRMRIAKALEYGAVWVQQWRGGVSHIIVDRSLSYKDLLSFLKIDSLPPDTVVVNELYPAECISYRLLINPKQTHYQVEGHVKTIANGQQIPSTAGSSKYSLPLKLERGEVARVAKTPSRTEENAEEVTNSVLVAETSSAERLMPMNQTDPDGPVGALEQAIREARALKDLPLDYSDEDQEETGSFASNNSDSEDSETEQKIAKVRKGPSNKSGQQNFICMTKHDGVGKEENPNARTIEVLQEMADYYNRINDTWRPIAYRKAISTLRKQTYKITTKEEAFSLSYIGEQLAQKIEEIVWTNRLRRLDSTKLEPADKVLQTFLDIYGVGLSVASKWVSQGHRSLSDLLQRAHLTDNQRIGIAHYDDFLSRIPRAEVEEHGAVVRKAALALDPELEIHIMGSYRRGAADCGDVDMVITKPGAPIHYLRNLLIESLVPKLFKTGFLQASLAATSRLTGTKWHGASAIPSSSVWRRIDFLLVPWEELGAALIYFTGNDIFNRSIRLLASKKGMRLNQRGLWRDVIRGQNRERITQGSLVEGHSEKRIFELLGVPWRPPQHRIC
ncbi:MAG: hypothetical protein M1812_001839 [Candelaria pacifica]|nr:MAG: hypothetical protein M1812_001839 [Candelaria pacifica]